MVTKVLVSNYAASIFQNWQSGLHQLDVSGAEAHLSLRILSITKGHWLKIISVLEIPLPVVCLHVKCTHGSRTFSEASKWGIFYWNDWIFIISKRVWIQIESSITVWICCGIIVEVWIELCPHVWILLVKPTVNILWVSGKLSIIFVIRVRRSRALEKTLRCLFLQWSKLCL